MALLTSGIRTIVETLPQCPPPSVPETTRMSTPACTCLIACSLAPSKAATFTPFSLPIFNIHFGGTPRAFAISLIGWEKATSKSFLAPFSFKFFPNLESDRISFSFESPPPLRDSPSTSYCFKTSALKSLYS